MVRSIGLVGDMEFSGMLQRHALESLGCEVRAYGDLASLPSNVGRVRKERGVDGIVFTAIAVRSEEIAVARDVVFGEVPVLAIGPSAETIWRLLGGLMDSRPVPLLAKVTSLEHISVSPILSDIPDPVPVAAYSYAELRTDHGLSGVAVLATSADGVVLFDAESPRVTGCNFLPESVLSRGAERIYENWVQFRVP